MKLWIDFYDLAAPDVPGCPDAMLNAALRQAAIDFCEQSLAWSYDHPAISVVAATSAYPFVPPAQAIVHAITYAKFIDTEIEVEISEDNLRIWNWRAQAGTPQYALANPTSVRLVPTPDLPGTLTLIVALKPSPTATGVDDAMFNEYREAIIHGAKARLMLSPKKPYTDAQLAQYHQQQFTIKTGRAGTRHARNYTREALRTSILRRW